MGTSCRQGSRSFLSLVDLNHARGNEHDRRRGRTVDRERHVRSRVFIDRKLRDFRGAALALHGRPVSDGDSPEAERVGLQRSRVERRRCELPNMG